MSETLEITIVADLPEGILAQKARDLGAALTSAGVPAHAPATAARSGERGVATAIGKLVVDQLVGPAAKTLLETLKGILIRDKAVTIELTRADGAKIKLDAKNITSAEAAGFLGVARDALG